VADDKWGRAKTMTPKCALLLGVVLLLPIPARAQSLVTFGQNDNTLQVRIDGKTFASYVWQDRAVRRPYLAQVHAPNGKQVTRTRPSRVRTPPTTSPCTPASGSPSATWGGADFWRTKGTVQHVEFVDKPKATKDGGTFAVRNRYTSGEKTTCEELCRSASPCDRAGT
jgi:hypothetical protein